MDVLATQRECENVGFSLSLAVCQLGLKKGYLSESESVAPVHVSARHVRPSSRSHVRILDIGESAVRLFRVGLHAILIQRETRC